ncbi:hypothetical protein KZZ52_41650 [Dactylosporangium sp. AC04546]|uniref:hypothetical protein n=1 Tax=Dactylosporangium sp. AC04546 TaxID=2862460 RepID=UPI001EDF90A0|nr:hypothetical protein [Dactylosporangium sp. AC04546]WVK80431.1 hypothetical protein KZZ52_41650 [Dactylosporangium sp. AC04546]
MNDATISWVDVEEWIQHRIASEGAVTNDLTLVVEHDHLKPDGRVMRIDPPIAETTDLTVRVRYLDYANPGDRWVRRHSVRAGGKLDWLRQASHRLADAFGWQPAQASVFVLAGITPLVAAVRITTAVVGGGRITLDIDPGATTDEVLAAFLTSRHERGAAHQRSMSCRNVRLAAFALGEVVSLPWSERYRRWSGQFPEWAYSAPSSFRRDAAAAARRLLVPDADRRPGNRPSVIFDDVVTDDAWGTIHGVTTGRPSSTRPAPQRHNDWSRRRRPGYR